jgi:hypothetical protein
MDGGRIYVMIRPSDQAFVGSQQSCALLFRAPDTLPLFCICIMCGTALYSKLVTSMSKTASHVLVIGSPDRL